MSFWMEVTVTKRQFIATNFAFVMNLIMFGWSGCRVCEMPISIKFADSQQLYQLYNCISMRIISVTSDNVTTKRQKNTATTLTSHRSLHTFRKTFFRFIFNRISHPTIDSGPSILQITFCYFKCIACLWVDCTAIDFETFRQIIFGDFVKIRNQPQNRNRWCKSFDVKLGMHIEWNVQCSVPIHLERSAANRHSKMPHVGKRFEKGNGMRESEKRTQQQLGAAHDENENE